MSYNITRRRLLGTAVIGAASVHSASQAGGGLPPDDENPVLPDYANRARILVQTLQSRWYHELPMPGWGQEQNEWNAHCTLDTLIDYTRITGDRKYVGVIRQVAGNQPLLGSAIKDGVDDMAWAAIAHVKAYRLIHNKGSIEAARQIFETMTHYWDDVCNGGVWWNRNRTYKNAITNELFLLLATSLYESTHDPDYLKWSHREWDWFYASGMINSASLINDGLDHCRNNRQTTWTYNQGVVLGGLAALHRITKQNTYLEQAIKIASAAVDRLTTAGDRSAILKEPVDVPNSDQQQFKGIFVKHLGQLTLALPRGSAPRKQFVSFICANADVVWNSARNSANEVSVYWHGGDRPPIYNATTQTAAIDLMNAAVSVHR